MKSRSLGFSLFELVISITLFIIFIGLFLQRVLYVQMESEKVAMEMTISNIRTGLQVEVSNMMFEHRTHEFPKLLRKNPILWLNKVPDNYLGEIVNPEYHAIRINSWYFDLGRGELVYRYNHDYNLLRIVSTAYHEKRFRVVSKINIDKQKNLDAESNIYVNLALVSDE